NIVDQEADAAVDVADHIGYFRLARPFAPFVDNGERGIDTLCEPACAHHAADIGRNHHDAAEIEALLDVAHHDGRGEEVVGRNVEEALDLPGVKVERQHPVDAGAGDQVGDELGGDRRARPGFAVLPGIAVVGNDSGDAPRRRAAQRIDDDQQF